jgi:hypothetical protein
MSYKNHADENASRSRRTEGEAFPPNENVAGKPPESKPHDPGPQQTNRTDDGQGAKWPTSDS